MTSVQRYINQIGKDVPKVLGVSGPRYDDSVLGYSMLVPFTYSNGTLDVALIDDFPNTFADAPFAGSGSTDTDTLSRVMGGLGLVQKIGPNLTNYLNGGWIPDTDLSTKYVITISATVTKVQTYLPTFMDGNTCFKITSESPASDTYPWGAPNDDYRVTWIFRTPLTLRFVDTVGATQYITFQSLSLIHI